MPSNSFYKIDRETDRVSWALSSTLQCQVSLQQKDAHIPRMQKIWHGVFVSSLACTLNDISLFQPTNPGTAFPKTDHCNAEYTGCQLSLGVCGKSTETCIALHVHELM